MTLCPHCKKQATDTITDHGFVLVGCMEYILQKIRQLASV